MGSSPIDQGCSGLLPEATPPVGDLDRFVRNNPRGWPMDQNVGSSHRTAAIATLVLAGAWPFRPARGPQDPATPCRAWVEVVRAGTQVLTCGRGTGGEAVRTLLGRCPPDRPVRFGDRLTPQGAPCRTHVTSLPASVRLGLGLRLDLNRASLSELVAIPGIGPRTARRIVDRRPYASVLDLERVRGIGPVRRSRFARWAEVGAGSVVWPANGGSVRARRWPSPSTSSSSSLWRGD